MAQVRPCFFSVGQSSGSDEFDALAAQMVGDLAQLLQVPVVREAPGTIECLMRPLVAAFSALGRGGGRPGPSPDGGGPARGLQQLTAIERRRRGTL